LIPHLDETWYGRGTVTISYEAGRRVRMSIAGKEEAKRSTFEKNWLITGTVATDDSAIDAAAKSLVNWGEGRLQLKRF
jgi:hypothetical protein